MTDTKDVGVDSHCRLTESDTLNDVGSLTPYTWKVEQLVHVGRNLTIVTLYQHTSHLDQMLSFGIRIGNATDIFQDIVHISLCHRGGIRIVAKEFGSHLIDALVRTLGTQNDCHQQLENTAKLQFRLYLRHFATEELQDICVAFLFIHKCKAIKPL